MGAESSNSVRGYRYLLLPLGPTSSLKRGCSLPVLTPLSRSPLPTSNVPTSPCGQWNEPLSWGASSRANRGYRLILQGTLAPFVDLRGLQSSPHLNVYVSFGTRPDRPLPPRFMTMFVIQSFRKNHLMCFRSSGFGQITRDMSTHSTPEALGSRRRATIQDT